MATIEPEIPVKPSSGHPPYAEMIITAITALNERNGSSRTAIAKYIDSTFSNLPSTHAALLGTHLHRLKEAGELFMVKHSYKLSKPQSFSKPHPNPNGTPRGRGRPRKYPAVVGITITGVKRSRGRPPKPKDPLATVAPPRPRGRPPKDPNAPRLRKLKDPLAPPKPRGRPPSLLRPRKPISSGRPRGRPRKLLDSVASPLAKPRGRPVIKVNDPLSMPKRRGRPPKFGAQPVAVMELPVEGGGGE